jgi:hypothetical protein
VSFTATVSVTDNASGSPQTVTLNGTGNPAPSFTVSSSTPSQTVAPGNTVTYSITVTPQNGAFTGAVSLAASGLPTGATATFTPSSDTPGSAAASSIRLQPCFRHQARLTRGRDAGRNSCASNLLGPVDKSWFGLIGDEALNSAVSGSAGGSNHYLVVILGCRG